MKILHDLASSLGWHEASSGSSAAISPPPPKAGASTVAGPDNSTRDERDDGIDRYRQLAQTLNGCESAVIVKIDGKDFKPLSSDQKREVDRLFHERGYFRIAKDDDTVVPYFPHCQVYPMRPDSPCLDRGFEHAVAIAHGEGHRIGQRRRAKEVADERVDG